MTRKIVLFLYDGFQLLDAAGPITVFEIASRFSPEHGYEIALAGEAAGRVRSSSGVEISVDALADVATIDTLVVVGGHGSREAMEKAETLRSLVEADGHSRRIASVCSGAFVLAAAGLLDGLAATTHWRVAASFAAKFPKVKALPDRIYVKQGRVWTSAGVSAGVDLSLGLVAEDVGEAIAKRVAREMVVYYRRPGGQSQFSALLELASPDHRFADLLDRVRGRLEFRWSVEALAEAAHMSPRHFSRAFSAATGLSPAKAVERLRLEAAREKVEAGIEPIEAIAREAGFGDPERMRRAFVQTYGVPPQSVRRQARAGEIGEGSGAAAAGG